MAQSGSVTHRDLAFTRSLELHHRIEALYPSVHERGFYFRAPVEVDRSFRMPVGAPREEVEADPIVCALGVKAATTKRAIVTLSQADDGDNALALTRVLVENAFLIEWLIRDEYRLRLEAYVMFRRVMHEKYAAMVNRFKERFIAAGAEMHLESDERCRRIAKRVFGTPRHNTATWNFDRSTGRGARVRAKEIFEEIGNVEEDLSFEYEVLYGALGSDIVHSGPLSLSRTLQAFRRREIDKFLVEAIPSPEGCSIALAISNTAMLLVLDSLNQYGGLGLAEDITTLKAEVQKNPHVVV